MKKTNILIEVSDDLYDNVVYPMKRQKRFSKLIVMLLKGYYENDYINAYIDGNVDVENKEGIEALDSVLKDMKSTISLMGMNTSELEQNTNEGLEMFNNASKAREKSKTSSGKDARRAGIGVGGMFGSSNESTGNESGNEKRYSGYVSSEEFDKLKEEFEETRRQNKNIMEMLSSLMKAGLANSGAAATFSEVMNTGVGDTEVGGSVKENRGTKDNISTDYTNDLSLFGIDEDKATVSMTKGTEIKDNSTEKKGDKFDMSMLDDVSIDIDFNDDVLEDEGETMEDGSEIFADLMSDAVYEF